MRSLKLIALTGFILSASLTSKAESKLGNYICTAVYGPAYTAQFELDDKKASFHDERVWIDIPFAKIDIIKSAYSETIYKFEKINSTQTIKVEFNLTRKYATVIYSDDLTQSNRIIQLQGCSPY